MLLRKGLTFGIILLLIVVSITPSTSINVVKQSTLATLDGNTLYVGGSGSNNYSKIQDAIDNASNGDTVFVFNDSSPYYENVIVDKSINLIGEDKYTTVVDGSMITDVVEVVTDGVNLTGFLIKNGTNGIQTLSKNNTINSNL